MTMILKRLSQALLMPVALMPLALGASASAAPQGCSNASLKGIYLYSESGVLNGRSYSESGREVYDGQGGLVLTYRGSDGSGGSERGTYRVSADCIGTATYPDGQTATSFISPDGSRFTYTMTVPPGRKPTALSGIEVRVAP
jgi:hypothetical protein